MRFSLPTACAGGRKRPGLASGWILPSLKKGGRAAVRDKQAALFCRESCQAAWQRRHGPSFAAEPLAIPASALATFLHLANGVGVSPQEESALSTLLDARGHGES